MTERRTALAQRIVAEAQRLGFDLVGSMPAGPAAAADRYRAWLERGFHGEMAYLARPDAVAQRKDLACLQPGVRTVVTVAANYYTQPQPGEAGDDPARGRIARYAWGADYHDVLTPRLRQLGAWIEAEIGMSVAQRAYVDTGPLLERELAARAGLGFIGKNSLLIHPRLGSWLFLGELLLSVELPAVRPGWPTAATTATSPCGACTRCLDACPTGALVAPSLLDARRCLAYLTIELCGPIPRELRPHLGNRIFGCDLCQEVCPWNRRFARSTTEPAFQPGLEATAPRLLALMSLDEGGFRRSFQGRAIRRARRRGLLRNVAVALGNWGDPAAVPALAHALHDAEPLVRGHAAWALGRINTGEASQALSQALRDETDGWVRRELQQAQIDQPQASPT